MNDLEIVIKETGVALCPDCGQCTSVCPVARYDAEFSPQLFVRKALDSGGKNCQDPRTWSCLNCRMCTEICSSRVDFPRFVAEMRTEAITEGCPVNCSHGGVLQTTMHLMARDKLKQKRLDWLPENVILTDQSESRLFIGCAPYFDVIFSELGLNTLDGVIGAMHLLNKYQIPFNLIANERCCGYDLLLQGDQNGFLALARANLAEFNRLGVKRLITCCPECYLCLKQEYARVHPGFNIEVVNLVGLVAPLCMEEGKPSSSLGRKITYHDSCALGRGFHLFDKPRQMLRSVPGVELVEMEHNREHALCCGAVPWTNCSSINRLIQEQRLKEACETQAEVLITSCPKCQIHLTCASRGESYRRNRVEILDLAAFIAKSMPDAGETGIP